MYNLTHVGSMLKEELKNKEHNFGACILNITLILH